MVTSCGGSLGGRGGRYDGSVVEGEVQVRRGGRGG